MNAVMERRGAVDFSLVDESAVPPRSRFGTSIWASVADAMAALPKGKAIAIKTDGQKIETARTAVSGYLRKRGLKIATRSDKANSTIYIFAA